MTENDLSYGEVRPPEMMHLISKMDKINFCFDAHVFKTNQTDVLEKIYIKYTFQNEAYRRKRRVFKFHRNRQSKALILFKQKMTA